MKKLRLFTIIMIILIGVTNGNLTLASAQKGLISKDDSPDTLIKVDQLVKVYYTDPASYAAILTGFDTQIIETNYKEGYHVLELSSSDIKRLQSDGFKVEIDPNLKLSLPEGSIQSIPGYSCYRTVEETFATAAGIATNYPDLAEWIDVGDSWEKSVGQPDGYDMMVLRLTNESIPGDKPALFVTSAIHARELTTAELSTRFAEYLIDNYNVDADVTWLLDYHEIHLLLQTNPDGRKEAEAGLSWRKNTNENYCGVTSNNRGADLNRNFTYMWNCCGGSSDNPCDSTYHGPYAGSEPETQAVMSYMQSIIPDQRGDALDDVAPIDATGVYIDFHSYGELVMWPWGFTNDSPPNGPGMQTLGRKWAYFNDYTPRQAIGLYPTDGATKDFAYGVLGIPGYTIELGTAFFQNCSTFENTILPDNIPVLLYAAKAARTPYITPSGPDAVNVSVSQSQVFEGQSVTLTAQINDTRYDNSNGTEPTQDVVAAEFYVDTPYWEDGATPLAMSAVDGSFNETVEDATFSIDTTGWSQGRHTLFVRGLDADGNWGAVSAVFLTVQASDNEPPVADDLNVNTVEDTPVVVTLTATDPDEDPLTFSVIDSPFHGTLSGTAPDLTYTPDPDYNGSDSFTYKANDGKVDSNTATASINITAVNDPPEIFAPETLEMDEDTSLGVNGISISDKDVDESVDGKIEIEIGVSHGIISLNQITGLNFSVGDGFEDRHMRFAGDLSDVNTALQGMIYAPDKDFYGVEKLELSASDLGYTGSGGALLDAVEVEITVNDIVDFMIYLPMIMVR